MSEPIKCRQCGCLIDEYVNHDQVCRYNFEPNLRDQFAMAALPWALPEARRAKAAGEAITDLDILRPARRE